MNRAHLLDFVHELDVLLQLPAHQSQKLFIFLLQHHRRHTALKELGDKHAGSEGETGNVGWNGGSGKHMEIVPEKNDRETPPLTC